MPEKITACCSRGVISLLRNTVETPSRMLPKALTIELQGHADFINGGRVVDHAQLPAELGILHHLEVRPIGDGFADQFGSVCRIALPSASTMAAS